MPPWLPSRRSRAPHDFGGVPVHYGTGDGTGSTFSDLATLAANGRTVS